MVRTAVSATDKTEFANAKLDGPVVLAPTATEETPHPPTEPPLDKRNALSAHTVTKNAVELTVEPATNKLENALARTDGPEVLALPVTENLETSPTEARLLNAQCAHTREPSAVEVTVETATDNLENAGARTDGPEVLARTKEESLEPDTLALTKPMLTLLTQPLPATWDLSGLLSSESSPPSAPFSLWS